MCIRVIPLHTDARLIEFRLFFTASEASGDDESMTISNSSTESNVTVHAATSSCRLVSNALPVHKSSFVSTFSSTDSSFDSNFLIVPSSNVTAATKFDREICSDLRKSERPSRPKPPRPRGPKRSGIDLTFFETQSLNNWSPEKRQSDPQIRYAFYNKGFEVATTCRKFSLTQVELRRNAMPHIFEQNSMEIDDDAITGTDEWKIAENVKNARRRNTMYSGSSGRDITLLPKLKIRICDEMGKRIESDTSDALNDKNDFSRVSFDSFDESFEQVNCYHDHPTTESSRDPFHCDGANARVREDFRKCKKCGHKLIRRQFTNSFMC